MLHFVSACLLRLGLLDRLGSAAALVVAGVVFGVVWLGVRVPQVVASLVVASLVLVVGLLARA